MSNFDILPLLEDQMIYTPRVAKILIFTSEGIVMEGGAYDISVQYEMNPYVIESDIAPPLVVPRTGNVELSATMSSEITLTQQIDDYKETIEKRKAEFLTSKKFQCEWCGSISKINNASCPHCGGWRPIFFELLEIDQK